MNSFEESLRKALERKSAPAGFPARVMAAVEKQATGRAQQRRVGWTRGSMRWLAPLAASLLLTSGLVFERYEERQQGLAARDKLLLALRVTGEKLQQAQQRVAVMAEGSGAR